MQENWSNFLTKVGSFTKYCEESDEQLPLMYALTF